MKPERHGFTAVHIRRYVLYLREQERAPATIQKYVHDLTALLDYLDGAPVKVCAARVHKGNILAALEGVADVNAAMALKGKTVSIDRSGVVLPEGRHFIADLLGLEVLDAGSGEKLGVVADVLTPPAHEVYVVKGEHEYMIPAVDEFLAETNVEGGYIKVRLIEGMRTDV